LHLEAYGYDCEGLYVVAHFKPGSDGLWLFLPSETLLVPHIPSGSGAKYSNGTVTFWSKGETALLDTGTGMNLQCTEDRRRSLVEDAKLRGMDFRGTGNEPPWVLEIGSEELVLFTGYDRLMYRFPNRGHADDPQEPATVWRSSQDGHTVEIILSGQECLDSMSDDRFETRVQVTLDQTVWHGCGQALH
jgi:uncharacterized membrane protein